ncbi:MAG: histidine phosphatase family protein [Burkholderiales bacterium]|nr:histidine phosphatase family protein [Burkholderiales bacterium]
MSGLAAAEPHTILLLRHAEKAAEPAADPGLSEAGQQRAQQLAEALRHAGVQHILVTKWRRTRDTAAPLAQHLGLPVQVLDARDIEGSAARLMALNGTVLVVGHSNTVTPLLAALGGPRLPWLCETSFSPLFVWRREPGAAPTVLRLRYGAGDAPTPAASTASAASAASADCL